MRREGTLGLGDALDAADEHGGKLAVLLGHGKRGKAGELGAAGVLDLLHQAGAALGADAVAGEHLHGALAVEAGVGGVPAQGVEVAQPHGACVEAVELRLGPQPSEGAADDEHALRMR